MKILTIIAGASALLWADWVKDSKDPAYPSELYFVGYGISDVSLEKAKSQAQNDIQKQIRVSLKTKLVDNVESETFKGKEFNSESTTMTSFSVGLGEVEGIQVVKTEQRDNLFYALTALDKNLFASNLKSEIKSLNDEVFTLISSAKEDFGSKKIAKALSKIYKAKKLVKRVDDLKKSLKAVETPGADLNSPYSEVELMALISESLESVHVEKLLGDDQQFSLGTLPKEAFVFKITGDAGEAIVGFEYSVIYKDKELARVFSDENGELVFYASEEAHFKKGKNELKFEPVLRLASKYKKEIRRLSVSFQLEGIKSTNRYHFKITGLESKEELTLLVTTLENSGLSNDEQALDEIEILVKKEIELESQGLSKKIQKINVDLVVKGEGLNETLEAKGLGTSPLKAFEDALSKMDFSFELPKKEKHTGSKIIDINVAVLPFTSVGAEEVQSVALLVRNQLVVNLSNLRGITLSERESINQVLSEKAMALTGLTEGEGVNDIQISGADYIIAGNVSKGGSEYQISLRLIDAKKGKVVKSILEFASDRNKIKAIGEKLISGLGVRKLQK